MRYAHLLSALKSSVWGIQPATLQAVASALHARMTAPRADADDSPLSAPSSQLEALYPVPAGIALIRINGVIGKHLSQMEMECGGCSLDQLERELAAACADTNVRAIAFDIDSPGGVTTGVHELAEKIRACGKPTFAFTDTQACSCAYWLASACDYIALTTTATIGAVECYIALVNESSAWASAGLKLELIKSGEFAGLGHPGQALADTERALLQDAVDTLGALFRSDVSQKRPQVAPETMNARWFMGQAALENGMADAVVSDCGAYLEQIAAQI